MLIQRQEQEKTDSEIAGDRSDRGPPEDVTGIWEFHLRVVNTTNDIVATTIPINQTAGGNLSGSGSGVDINGQAMNISITGHYDASINEIWGTITSTFEVSPTRIDERGYPLSASSLNVIK